MITRTRVFIIILTLFVVVLVLVGGIIWYQNFLANQSPVRAHSESPVFAIKRQPSADNLMRLVYMAYPKADHLDVVLTTTPQQYHTMIVGEGQAVKKVASVSYNWKEPILTVRVYIDPTDTSDSIEGKSGLFNTEVISILRSLAKTTTQQQFTQASVDEIIQVLKEYNIAEAPPFTLLQIR